MSKIFLAPQQAETALQSSITYINACPFPSGTVVAAKLQMNDAGQVALLQRTLDSGDSLTLVYLDAEHQGIKWISGTASMQSAGELQRVAANGGACFVKVSTTKKGSKVASFHAERPQAAQTLNLVATPEQTTTVAEEIPSQFTKEQWDSFSPEIKATFKA